MKIVKILNNNAVIIHNAQGKEQVLMGKGLGFQKKAGDAVDAAAIEKIFSLQQNAWSQRLSELLAEIPLEVVTTTECIIALAKETLSDALHESFAVALLDHIHFALQRHQQRLALPPLFNGETRLLHPREYHVGLQALDIIASRLGVRLARDEADSIALHLVNAQLHSDLSDIMRITTFMQQVLAIVRDYFTIDYPPDTPSYPRFVTHLKFFALRMLNNSVPVSDDTALHDMVRSRCREACGCVEKIERYLAESWGYQLSSEERLYLMLHIERIRKEAMTQIKDCGEA